MFFDLVYVFAVTQLSHLVIDAGISVTSVIRAAFLLLVVWWAWIYTTWMVNWFDPESFPVRLILTGVALASLLMSAAIPTAFGGEATLFAAAYVAMQVGRNLAAMLLLSRDHALRRVFERLVAWSCASGVALDRRIAAATDGTRPWSGCGAGGRPDRAPGRLPNARASAAR